jgi:hypothetical protein
MNDDPNSGAPAGEVVPEEREAVLEGAILELPYIPDFLLDEVWFWMVPSRDELRAVYHELVGQSAKNWQGYYTRKGWNFLHSASEREGPSRVRPGGLRLEILEPGRFFQPSPQFRFEPGGQAYPVPSLEKRRPINEWKPNYIQALNFIKKYEWTRPVPRSAQLAVWEIEECGQIPGSTSWRNAEALLLQNDSEDLRATLADLFFNRPEDYQLGSEVYLRVLGKLGEDGFRRLLELAGHPVTKKRKGVARMLGELEDPRGRETLLMLLDDEDPGVRREALRTLGKVGVAAGEDPEGRVKSHLESPELPERVWASQALLKGGDEEHRKFLLQLVKEDPKPLSDLGELGEVLDDLGLVEAVPYLIQRLKSDRREIVLDAAEALKKLTGVEIEYSVVDDEAQKRQWVKTFTRWWEERKRERRRGEK